MKSIKILTIFVVAVMSVSLLAKVEKPDDAPKGKGWDQVWDALVDLQGQIDNIQPIPGPPGQPGDSHWQLTGMDTYYNNGNVGIGTSTPSEKLTVNGDAKVVGQFIPEGGIVNSDAITIESTANMVKLTAGGSTITMDSSGKITIDSASGISINTMGTLDLSGTNVKIAADASLDMVGSIIRLNGPGLPAARQTDMVIAPSGVGTIQTGSPTVMIGPSP